MLLPYYLDEITPAAQVNWGWIDASPQSRLCRPKVVPDPDVQPIKLQLRGSRKMFPDYTVGGTTGSVIVSRRFRDVVERFEPDVHHFIAAEVYARDGAAVDGEFYLFKMGHFIDDGIIVEESDVNRSYLKGEFIHLLPTSQQPRLMWRASKIAGRHLWADSMFAGANIASDALYAALKAEKTKGFFAIECRIRADL